jgi:DNA-directed RNA polymerase beta' subunit
MEMNVFCPQSIEAQIELEEIADLKLQIITPQSSSPIIAIQQDQLLGTWNLTQEYYKLDWRTTMNLLSGLELDKFNNIVKNKEYTGKEIYSYLIPPKINLLKGDPSNPKILVSNGKMVAGLLGDDALGVKKKNSLVQLVWDEYGVDITKRFIDNTTRLATDFNLHHGMSMGIGDLFIPDELYQQLLQMYNTKKLELQHEITELENNPDMMSEDLFENSTNSKLAVIRDDASKVIMGNTTRSNNAITMIDSGAKGKTINVAQMIGCVGQQAYLGGRMKKNYNDRTLPYFFKNDDRAEARGFVEKPFVKGLKLPDFIFHHLAAREGLIDTTVRSVTPDTKIVIIENSKPKIVEIGSWIDSQLEPINISNPELIERDKNNFELLKVKGIKIPTVDELGNTSWGEVTAITRHDPGLQLFEIVTRGGRKVIVPESKSLLIWNSQTNKFEEKLTPDVVLGDCVPVTMNLETPPTITRYIDMTEYFPKSKYIYGTDFIKAKDEMDKAMEGRDKIPSGWWNNSNGTIFTLPYERKALFQRTQVRSNNDNVREGFIYPYGAKKEHVLIPDKFELNKLNGQFIGLFLADGNIDIPSGYIQITKNNELVREFAKKWFDNYKINYTEDIRTKDIGTSSCIRGRSVLMAKFITELVGHGSHNKHIPIQTINAPEEFIIGLIDGYISGDGTIGSNCIEASSSSKDMIEGISYCLSRLGIFAKTFVSKHKDDEKGFKHNVNTHRLSIRGQWANQFKSKVQNLLNPEKNDKLEKLQGSEIHINYKEQNDVVLDKIVEINPIEVSKYKKLYDLTVPSTNNFIIFNGMGVYDTAQSGYIQRKLIKATEDMMVNYDGTVRNAVGRILQFQYGDSGADTVKQYEYNFKLMEMGNEEINSKYGMTKEELSRVKGWTEKDNKEFVKRIMDMRDKLRLTQTKTTINYLTLTTTYFLPVNLNRILDSYRNDDSLKGTVCMEPKYIIDMIIDILEPYNTRLYAMTEDEMKNKNSVKYKDDQIAKTAFGYAMMDLFAPSKCIFKYKLSKSQLDEIKKDIIRSFNKSIVEPGEMVGIIAAQSLGEPVTQLMLKSFHSSGIGGKGGTDIGVDTITEVFSLSKNPKAPAMEIYFEKDYRTKKDYVNKIASYIKFTTIKDLRSKMEIFYEPSPDDFDGFLVKDNVGEPFYTYQANKMCCAGSIDGLPWLLRIEFDKEKLLSKEVTLLDIKSQFCFAWEKRYSDVKGMKREKKQLIDKITQISVQSNTDNDEIPVIHIRFDMTNFTQTTLIDFMDIFVDDFKLKGMPNIDDVNSGKAFEERILSFDNADKSMEKNSEYVIYTKGINMEAIKNIVGVDLNRTYCNDIITIYENYGIESARNYIIRRIIDVLASNGSGTNYQHVQVFGDLMTQVGTLTSIDRHGLNKLDNDPLSRASFEKTVDQLITAAVFNEVDYMKSVSSRIMAGLCIKGGTGLCNLILDKEMLENSEYTTDIGQLYNKTYKDITSTLQTQEVDSDVFIPEM